MDIHLPKVPHGWRDLAKEIAIIVVGVLIALTAEQIVDDWQWRHKIDAAKKAMQRELLYDDGPQVVQRVAMHPCLSARLDAIQQAVEKDASRQEVGRLVDSYWVDIRTFDRLALDAADASDVASHIPQEELEPYNVAYEIIPTLSRTNVDEGANIARMRAFVRTGGPLTLDEKDRLLDAVGALRNDDYAMGVKSRFTLTELRQIGPLDPGRVRMFLADARAHYGNCVNPHPTDFPEAASGT